MKRVFCAMLSTALFTSVFAEKVLINVDLTPGASSLQGIKATVTGGKWEGGFRIVGLKDHIKFDGGYIMKNGYVECTYTLKGSAMHPGDGSIHKRNWFGVQECVTLHDVNTKPFCMGGYFRTGDPGYGFAKVKAFSDSPDGICENKVGSASEWKGDDIYVHKVKIQWLNGKITFTTPLGKTTSCGGSSLPVNRIRYAWTGTDTYFGGSLPGQRFLSFKMVDLDGGATAVRGNVQNKLSRIADNDGVVLRLEGKGISGNGYFDLRGRGITTTAPARAGVNMVTRNAVH